jgi:hypothetical protein
MSSFPLISHHLFVAAVNDKNCDRQMSGQIGQAHVPPEVLVKEIPMELVDFGNPRPVEAACPSHALPLTGST